MESPLRGISKKKKPRTVCTGQGQRKKNKKVYTRRRAYAQQKTKLQPLQIRAAQRAAQLNSFYWDTFPSRTLPNNHLGFKWALYMMRTLAFLPVDRRGAWLYRHANWLGDVERGWLLAYGPCWYGAGWLGQALEVDDETRTRLKFWSVLPVDIEWSELQRRRKENRAMRQKVSRRRMPREQWLAENSASRTEPWKALGIGRTKYYEQRRTGVCTLNICSNARHTPVRTQSPAKAARICDTPSKEATKSSANDNAMSQTSIQSSSRGRNIIEDRNLGEFGHASLPNSFWRPINGLPRLPGYIVHLPIPALKEAA
jgi:hypothetical protein